jgi:quercetin dioxygenase-like cupin family protein
MGDYHQENGGFMSFFSESDLPAKQPLDGITLKAISGDKTMMTFFAFESDAMIPSHKHPHEQITYVLEGELEFTVGEDTRILRKGDGVVISSNQEHSAKVLKAPAKAVDAWHPLREDYL